MNYVFSEDHKAKIRIADPFDSAIRKLEPALFEKFSFRDLCKWYHEKSEPFAFGEFWGKVMRGAALCYEYTGSQTLKYKMNGGVEELVSCAEPNGNISCVKPEHQPGGEHGADLWERKYVMLGLLGYYQACHKEWVLDILRKEADVLIEQVGPAPKRPLTDIYYAFHGVESASVLDPIMKLYNITKEPRYLEFARYIVEDTGCCSRGSIFEAIEKGVDPKDVGSNGNPRECVCKAYEMMSCYEGLVQYAVATGSDRWKKVAVMLWDKLVEQEITLLGSGGSGAPFNNWPGDGELWNHTRYEQTNPAIDLTMETCVTITWMKFCGEIMRLTGDSKVYDEIERSAYNALMGSLRPDGGYFDYFQRFNGRRNNQVNFGWDFSGFLLTCCSANGPAGLCRMPWLSFLRDEKDGLVINSLAPSSFRGEDLAVRVEGGYPLDGNVRITVERAPDRETGLSVRIPGWAKNPAAMVGGEILKPEAGSYLKITRNWKPGDVIVLQFELETLAVPAPHGSDRAGDNFTAYVRGPLVLTRDCRYDPRFDQPQPAAEGPVSAERMEIPGTQAAFNVNGMIMVDYASAGATWDDRSEFRTWIANA